MDGTQTLFLVLAALYLTELPVWVGPASLGFRTVRGKRWRGLYPNRGFGAGEGSLHPAFPFPPLGTVLVTHLPPATLTPAGLFRAAPPALPPACPPTAEPLSFPFEAIERVAADDRALRINGKFVLKTGSRELTAHLASLLLSLAKSAPGERPALIRKEVRRQFDTKALRKRLNAFQKETAGLAWLCNSLFVYLFVAAPVVIGYRGLVAVWLPLLAGLVLLAGFIARAFRAAHKSLYPQAAGERHLHMLRILLSPLSAIRARDQLSRELLATFHPLAAAFVLAPVGEFRELAARFIRDGRHPVRLAEAEEELLLGSALKSERGQTQEAIERLVQNAGLSIGELLAAPDAEPSCNAYCPRCRSQFVQKEGVCSDCPGVELQPLPGNAADSAG